jgi:hypothetical protein
MTHIYHYIMKLLSIDVGIKNLAFCLFDKSPNSEHFQISKWDVVNISTPEFTNCCVSEKNGPCSKSAKYQKNGDCYCLKHAKKQTCQIPPPDLKLIFLKKQPIKKVLLEIANKYGILYTTPVVKQDLFASIAKYTRDNYLQEIISKNASKVDLIEIGANIKEKFNHLFVSEAAIDYIIIENQISPIANRMKTIQGMIVQYFIMSGISVANMEFVSASNKLKDCATIGKTKYSDRKKMGITKCRELLTSDNRFVNQSTFFNNHTKKDDLADSFLQGLWYINDKNI